MPLSWNQIKHRAIAFSKDWKNEAREEAEAKSFWDAFFNVFGVLNTAEDRCQKNLDPDLAKWLHVA